MMGATPAKRIAIVVLYDATVTEMFMSLASGAKALLITAWQKGPRKARKETWVRTASLSQYDQLSGYI